MVGFWLWSTYFWPKLSPGSFITWYSYQLAENACKGVNVCSVQSLNHVKANCSAACIFLLRDSVTKQLYILTKKPDEECFSAIILLWVVSGFMLSLKCLFHNLTSHVFPPFSRMCSVMHDCRRLPGCIVIKKLAWTGFLLTTSQRRGFNDVSLCSNQSSCKNWSF